MKVEEQEYARLLGYPWGTLLEGDVRERAEQAAEWFEQNGRPSAYCVSIDAEIWAQRFPLLAKEGWPSEARSGGSLTRPRSEVFGVSDHPDLASLGHPSFARRGNVTAITAGREVDVEVARLWEAGHVDEAYFLDRYAAAIVEKMARDLGPYQSPGTGEMPFEAQWMLFEHIKPLNPEMEMLPSGMLNPKNSLLAFIPFDADTTPNPCTRCDLRGCTFRRTTA